MSGSAQSIDARQGLRAVSPALCFLGRAGYAAKGFVYVVIGALAAGAAVGAGGATTDSKGALSFIGDGPLGQVALIAIGVGLLGYTAWALVAAATDAEGHGDEPSSLAARAGEAISGLGYGALGVQALRALGHDQPKTDSDATQHWAAKLLDLPLGRAIVVAVGVGVLVYAIYQVYQACTDGAREHLDLAEAGPTAAKWIVRLGRFGIGARAVVLVVIGVFIARAGAEHESYEAGGIAESLRALGMAEYGRLILSVVAFGLIAFGVYQLATARYRHMRAFGRGLSR